MPLTRSGGFHRPETRTVLYDRLCAHGGRPAHRLWIILDVAVDGPLAYEALSLGLEVSYLAQAMRLDFSCRELPLAHCIEIAGSVKILALLQIGAHCPRDVAPQHHVIPRFRNHMLARLAVDDIFNEPFLWQHINLDAKPNIIQQQDKRALIHYATARFDL